VCWHGLALVFSPIFVCVAVRLFNAILVSLSTALVHASDMRTTLTDWWLNIYLDVDRT